MTPKPLLLTAGLFMALQLTSFAASAEETTGRPVWNSGAAFESWAETPMKTGSKAEAPAATAEAPAAAKTMETQAAPEHVPAAVSTPVTLSEDPAPAPEALSQKAETSLKNAAPSEINPAAAKPAAPAQTLAPESAVPQAFPAPATVAQPASAPAPARGGRTPIEISASKSLEWNRTEKTYTAIGDAIAQQGNMKVAADRLTARYDASKGSTDISKIEADNNVTLQSTPYTGYGDRAVYDTVTGIAVMTGKGLRIETPTEKLTATEKIEFFDRDNRLTATGSPVITRAGDKLTANIMNAYFKTDEAGKRSIDRFTADGNVVIRTPKETVTGDKGVYSITTQKATITGNIRIIQGDSTIEGTRADIDLATGISKLFAEDNKQTGGRVKGVFFPSSKK